MDAASLHRRLYRLALLLTGRPERAGQHAHAVADSALGRRPRRRRSFAGLSTDRLERQVLLACRRDPPAAGPVAPGFGLLDGLPMQFREAFVLTRVLGRSLREAARAMDCSRTAVRRHLIRADEAMLAAARTAGHPRPDLASLVVELRRALQAAPGAPAYRPAASRPARVRRLRLIILILATLAVVFAAGWAWRAWPAWRPSGGSTSPGTAAPRDADPPRPAISDPRLPQDAASP